MELKCRDCPPEILEQCIAKMRLSDAAKRALRAAFAEGTANPMLERYLQANCPLYDEAVSRQQEKRSGLLSRMSSQEVAGRAPAETQKDKPAKPPEASSLPQGQGAVGETIIADASVVRELLNADQAAKPLRGPSTTAIPSISRQARVLIAPETNHRILLPRRGALTLGSWHTLEVAPPDVDLCYDDHGRGTVASLHAKVLKRRAVYYVEDLGSGYGTWLNSQTVKPNSPQRLRVGDVLQLGECALNFGMVPESWAVPGDRYFLRATSTGTKFLLPRRQEIVVGRADPDAGFTPQVDLSAVGDAAYLVSRQHASIRCWDFWFEVTDLGSTNGTKLDGVLVHPGLWLPFRPGQHLSLGGFGLVLDVEESA